MTLRTHLLLITSLAVPVWLAGAAHAQEPSEEDFELRGFSIYDTQAAKARARIAEEHVDAGRWSEALSELQRLIEEHRGEVLGPSRPLRAGRKSRRVVHRGASDHARARLFTLGDEARRLYSERYSERASKALHTAIEAGDRGALTQIARRWPITLEAQRAWWSLGDLELELGNTHNCLQAWGRALAYALADPDRSFGTTEEWRAGLEEFERVAAPDHPGRTGAGSRVELAVALLAGERTVLPAQGDSRTTTQTGRGWSTALAPGRTLGDPLGKNPDSWAKPVELPEHPFERSRIYSLFPARWNDTIFVSTTLEVLAIGAFTGEPLWRSGERLTGWSDLRGKERQTFFEAVDIQDGLIAAAADQGVVVAALQIPYSLEKKVNYGDMPIIKKIPTRRLFAFDAVSGEHLWDTRPPLSWDGQSGSFEDRVRVVGPPVIEGSRVLVPTVLLAGRIEYHVGCFDLHSGELLWSTVLITGQSELNMFGRQEEEFSAPPLTVAGNRVIALTQLGILAALDLFTGDVLWELVYDQIPLPPSRHIRAQPRKTVWSNAPPVVVDDVIVATPHDSTDLMAVDLASGHLIWDLDHLRVERMSAGAEPRLLVGADDDTIYLSGRRVVALTTPGLGTGPPERQRWAFPPGETIGTFTPRPVLAEDRVYIPDSRSLFTVDRRTGRRLAETGWDTGQPGNLLVGDGMMFALDQGKLSGYFEWEKLVARAHAELERDPDDIASVLNLAVLLEKRGVSEWQDGRTKTAHEHLRQARSVLEDFAQGGLEETHHAIRTQLHSILRGESRILKDLADTQGALALLERARALVGTREDLRDTLLEEQSLLRGRDVERWLDVVGILDAECSDLDLFAEAEWTGERPRPWTGHLEPVIGSAARPDVDLLRLPIGLWVLIERAELFGTLGRSAEEFADLHRILETYPLEPLGSVTASAYAADRVRAKLARGDLDGYAVFEERAGELLEAALELEDAAELERVSELYPGSRAAHRANDARLSWAVDARDAREVAEIVLHELPDDFRLQEASERAVRHLLRLAWVLGEAGNLELRGALIERLADVRPDMLADIAPVAGQPLSELARTWAAPPPAPTAEAESSFDHHARRVQAYRGKFEPVGEVEPGDAGENEDGTPDPAHVVVFSSDNELTAFSDESEGEPLWQKFLPHTDAPGSWKYRYGTTRGRAHFATHMSILTLDREDGSEVWSWDSPRGEIVSMRESDGVLVVSVDLDSTIGKRWVVAFDAAQGVMLWEQTVDWRSFRQWPVCGDGRLVLMPQQPLERGEVLDLFTGTRIAEFRVRHLHDSFARESWIQDEKLIIPRLRQGQNPERNHIFGIDLTTGEESWRVDFENGHLAGRELHNVLTYQGRAFLVLYPSRGGGRRGAIYELNTNIGSVSSTPIVELRDDDTLLGIRKKTRTDLPSPYLFVRSEPKIGEFYTLHAVHLPYGTRWDAQLPFQEEHSQILSSSDLALSKSTLVIYWPEGRKGSSARGTLLFFDRKSGRKLDDRVLSNETGGSSSFHLQALGDTLFICGMRQMEVLR